MKASEIRKRFLDFFEKRAHTVVPSDLLVPKDDPTLLFTGAGMNQFKDQFMGRNITYKRAASSQKCLRTGDIENVGRTPRHHTFFEMLGNFSFGDYFKKDAIKWAWEFLTKEMDIPKEKLWISVYEKDDEAYKIWLDEIGVPAEKIVRLGPADNFWPADAPAKGPNGPCGPCSEIFYDWGKKYGCDKDACDPSCSCGRFVEVWNLVFTEFDRQPDGSLKPLPSKNIDTGMGLERIAAVMQGGYTNFKTDLFTPIISFLRKELADIEGLKDEDFYLMADHARAVAFTVTDGVSPSNEKRGYVVRKLIRRAWLKGAGHKGPFLYKAVPVVSGIFKDVYPELEEKKEHVAAIIKEEEKRFNETLNTAMPVLETMLQPIEITPTVGSISHMRMWPSQKRLTGENIFKLVDTYGMPFELIEDMSKDMKFSIETAEYEKLMEERKEQSRKGSDLTSEFIFKPDDFASSPKPGYSDKMPLEAEIVFILKDGKSADVLREKENGEIIVSPQSSSFYAESGGQVGDKGAAENKDVLFEILDTYETNGRKVLHGTVRKGSLKKNEKVLLKVDGSKKAATARNHTATHLLQAALRNVLGGHVKQSGSFVDDTRLRFDFTHMKKLSERELIKVEELVNEWISENTPVTKVNKNIKDAREEGALSFFGEKYSDIVRVVEIKARSKEFCGGTHVDNTGEIGVMKIISESSVASGIRRIEAVTSEGAVEWVKGAVSENLRFIKENQSPVAPEIKDRAERIVSGKTRIDKDALHYFEAELVPAFLGAKRDAEEKAKKKQKEEALAIFERLQRELDALAGNAVKIKELNYVPGVFKDLDTQLLRKAVSYISDKVRSGVIFLGSIEGARISVISSVSADLVAKGIDAREIIKEASRALACRGGGKPEYAQGGGENPEAWSQAAEDVKNFILRQAQ